MKQFETSIRDSEEGLCPSLTIVIPAYNEARRLPPSLLRIVAWAQEQVFPVDIILVDDGSTDGTADLAKEAVGEKIPLTVLINEPNRGKGYSVKRGMLAATGEWVLFTDADLSTPITDAQRLMKGLEDGADIAIGSRGMLQSEVQVHQPWWREKPGKFFGFLVRLFALPGIRDSQCGFKCFRREAVQKVFPLLEQEGWAFDVEMLIIARKLQFRIAEVPVHWVNDPDSKVKLLRDGPRMLIDIFRARLRHRNLHPPVKP